MSHDFDSSYWQQHWVPRKATGADISMSDVPAHAYLAQELTTLRPGRALDVGCGVGAEALWLAARGWEVTGLDISSAALSRARTQTRQSGLQDRLTWIQQDVTTWQPQWSFDLVLTSYAHSVIPQLDLYERIAHWVRPGGTLFVVGHAGPEPDRHCAQNLAVEGRDAFGHDPQGHQQGHVGGGAPPAAASVTVRDVVARLQGWEVIRAENSRRTIETSDGRQIALHDVVVRAVRAAGDGGEESAEQQGVVEP